MELYVLKSYDFVKVGVSEDFKKRRLAYKKIDDCKVFYGLNEDLAFFIESSVVTNFKSDTEYLYGVAFEDVVSFVESKLNVKISDFYFNPLELNLKVNTDGYYDLSVAVKYVNDLRRAKGKNEIFVADYAKTKQAKEFLSIIESKYGIKPLIAKAGKYGGTYAVPEVVIDFLIESDVSVKYQVMNWAYKNQIEYKTFINIAIKTALGE